MVEGLFRPEDCDTTFLPGMPGSVFFRLIVPDPGRLDGPETTVEKRPGRVNFGELLELASRAAVRATSSEIGGGKEDGVEVTDTGREAGEALLLPL